MWFKKNASKEINFDESNYLCSKCLKKMDILEKNNVTIIICPKCKGMLIDKFNYDNTLQYFLKEGKIV